MIGWIIAFFIGLLVVLILLSDLEVKVAVKRADEKDRWVLKFRWLYGLVRYEWLVPKMNFRGREGLILRSKTVNEQVGETTQENKMKIDEAFVKKEYRKLKELIKNTFGISRWLKETLSHVRCVNLHWHTQIGAGDAMETATLTGLAWTLKGSLIGYLSNQIKLRTQPRLYILPLYNQTKWRTELNCIFKIRTGYAMIAGLLLLVRILRIKGGIKTWQSILSKAS